MKTSSHQLAGEQAPVYGQVKVASFGVARVGGIPAGQLDGLRLQDTVQHLNAVFASEAAALQLTTRLEEALFRLVPLVGDDRELRRRILAVKRNIHNMRLWLGAADDIERVCAAMEAISKSALAGHAEVCHYPATEDSRLLHDWFALASQREEALKQAIASYEREISGANATLAEGIQRPDIQQGLALTSPDLLAGLSRVSSAEEWRPTSKLARSSLSYLTRAAFKTSPLSTFTHLSVVDFANNAQSADTQPQASHAEGASRQMRLIRTLPATLLMRMATVPQLAPALRFQPNPGLCRSQHKAGKIRVLLSNYTLQGDFAWRRESTTERAFDPERAPALCAFLEAGQSLSYAELLRLLPGGQSVQASTQAHKALIQLLDMQLIKPVAPYTRRDPQPLLALAQSLEKLQTHFASAIAGDLRRIQQLVAACLHASGSDRLRLIEEMRQVASALLTQLGAAPPDWLRTNNLLYEDVKYHGATLNLNPQVQQDLAQVADVLRPSIARAQVYDYLYRYFIERCGPDGEISDILSFLGDFFEREDANELLTRSLAEDRTAMHRPGGRRSVLSAGASATPPSVTIFYQLLTESQEALDRGEYKLVVNQVCPGQGGLLGRFADLLGPEHGALDVKLRSWLETLYGGRSVVEMPVVGDWSNLQSEIGLTTRTLRWPAELPTSDDESETLELRDLRMRANTQDETLYLVDGHGNVIAPSYLGVVPMHLISHAVRLFLMLLDPWTSDYPIGWHTNRFSQNEHSPEQVEFFARQEAGRVVLRRARWRFALDAIPTRAKGESDFDFFVRVQRWRREHNLPEEVFANSERSTIVIEAKARKPVWISFSSPHAIELLRQLIDKDVRAVCLTEALPARHQHWVQPRAGNAQESRVSEFMTLACWPMPQSAALVRNAEDSFQSPSRPLRLSMPPTATPSHGSEKPAHHVQHRSDNWLYVKIYPPCSDQIDGVIRQIVGPIVNMARERQELKRWFFIRYMDARGWHVRFRLQGSAEMRNELQAGIDHLAQRVLLQVEHNGPRHLLPASYAPPPAVARPGPGYELARYEPEYEKYGGNAGVAIAEQLFEASSEVALQAMEVEKGVNRMLLSLCLMKLLVNEVFHEPEARKSFWDQYLWYWSGQDRQGAAELRASFLRGAQSRRITLARQLPTFCASPQVRRLINQYRVAIVNTIDALATAGNGVSEPASGLCFDYMHMNNNRLGVLTLEESYLVALLLEVNDTFEIANVGNL